MFNSLNRGLAAAANRGLAAAANRGLAAAANRGLAAAAHMARLNQRRTMASMAKQKEDEMKNWSCDEVSSYARTVIDSEVFIRAFQAEELDGKSLLDLPQDQKMMDYLVSAGMKITHVRKLAKAVRERVAPEPKTILIDLSEEEGVCYTYTIEDQKMMNKVLPNNAVGGFIDCSSDSDGVLIRQIEELTDGHTYRMAHDRSDRVTKLEGGFQTLQGTLRNIDEALEFDTVTALHAHLMEKLGNTGVVVKLDAKRSLHRPPDSSSAKPTFLEPDGLFMVYNYHPEKDDGRSLHNSRVASDQLWILEAKLSLTSQYAKAESDLQKYKEAAKLQFPSVGSIVTVMAGHCCDDTYKALTASASGFKILRQNGTEFTLSG